MCHSSSPPRDGRDETFFASTAMEDMPPRSRHAFAQTRTPPPPSPPQLNLPNADVRRHPERVTSPCQEPTAVAAASARRPAPRCPSSCGIASTLLVSDADPEGGGPTARNAPMLSSSHHHHHHHYIAPVPTVYFRQAGGDGGADDGGAALPPTSSRRRRPPMDGRRKEHEPAGGGSAPRGDHQDAMSVAIAGSLIRKNGGGGGPSERKYNNNSNTFARASSATESLSGFGGDGALRLSPEHLNQAIFLVSPYAGSERADERIFHPLRDEIPSSQSRHGTPDDPPASYFHTPPLGQMLPDEPLPKDTAYDSPESPRLRARSLPMDAVPDVPESPRLGALGSDFDEEDELERYQPIVPSFPFPPPTINKFTAPSTELTEASLRKLDIMRHMQKYSLRGARYPGHQPSPLGPFRDRFHGTN